MTGEVLPFKDTRDFHVATKFNRKGKMTREYIRTLKVPLMSVSLEISSTEKKRYEAKAISTFTM